MNENFFTKRDEIKKFNMIEWMKILNLNYKVVGSSIQIPDYRGKMEKFHCSVKISNPDYYFSFNDGTGGDIIDYVWRSELFPECDGPKKNKSINFLFEKLNNVSSEESIRKSKKIEDGSDLDEWINNEKIKNLEFEKNIILGNKCQEIFDKNYGKLTAEASNYLKNRGLDNLGMYMSKSRLDFRGIQDVEKSRIDDNLINEALSDTILIPWLDYSSKIIGLQERYIGDCIYSNRYFQKFSSQAGVLYPKAWDNSRIYITEGHFKGVSIVKNENSPVLCLMSANTRKGIVEQLIGILVNYKKNIEDVEIVVALDMDIWENKNLNKCLWDIIEITKLLTDKINIAVWNKKYNGIDDYYNSKDVIYKGFALYDYKYVQKNYNKNNSPISFNWAREPDKGHPTTISLRYSDKYIYDFFNENNLIDRLLIIDPNNLNREHTSLYNLTLGLGGGSLNYVKDLRENEITLLNIALSWINEITVIDYFISQGFSVKKTGSDAGFTFKQKNKKINAVPDLELDENIYVEISELYKESEYIFSSTGRINLRGHKFSSLKKIDACKEVMLLLLDHPKKKAKICKIKDIKQFKDGFDEYTQKNKEVIDVGLDGWSEELYKNIMSFRFSKTDAGKIEF